MSYARRMTTPRPTPDDLPAQHRERVRLNVEAAAGRFELKPRELADALGLRTLEVVRRRRRGEKPWTLEELSQIVALINTRPSGAAFDLADLTRPLE